MAVTPPQGAGPAGAPGRVRGRQVVRAATVAVVVVGLVITGVLAVVTFRGHQRTQRTLLDLQTTLIADAGEAEDQLYVEDHLGGAATLAAATDGDVAMFRQAMSTTVGGGNAFVTGSLWRLNGSSPQLITEVGAQPLVPVSTALMRGAETSRPFFVTELETPHALHLAFAAAARGKDGTFIAYAEEPLPANRRITEPAGSPVAQLNLAVYLGRSQTSSALLETDSSAPLPLRGTTDTIRIAFGNTVLTITTSPQESLSGITGEILPWAIVVGGLLVTLLAALLTERLIRRREDAEQLTRQVSKLYMEQRSVADTLQHALLPQRLPDIPGVEIAVRYVAGASGVDIGGDWYDVVRLDDHRFVFIVGDVSGRGVRAAAVMASLQFAGRAYAQEGYSPAMILERLSRSVDIERDAHFATVLCGLADVTAHTMLLASAGHLPPLILSGGDARFVTTKPGPPVGIPRKVPIGQAEVTTAANDVLIAYTDGLVERRGEMLDVGLKRLQAAASLDSSSLDNMLSSIVTELSEDTPTDDIALIGLKWLT
ncbi:MAG: Two component signal transduction histidine kinase [Actinomycetia bacterium]|nr:Two component signal transduction histidine kinase [Actinomycetes bacterium]